MKRKSKRSTHSAPYLKYLILGLLIAVITTVIAQATMDHLKTARIFIVKNIVVDPASPLNNVPELLQLKGKNIFQVDVQTLQERLIRRYPEVVYVKVVKRFPDQIIILTKKRNLFAQVILRSRTVMVDKDGVVLTDSHMEADNKLPLIRGVTSGNSATKIGYPLTGENLFISLNIIKAFQESPVLAVYPLSKIDAGNLSKINVHILNNVVVILDDEAIKEKLKMLEIVFTQGKPDLSKIKYIDLRFKEPILGKR